VSRLPSGTVTLLFSDIDGSTRLLSALGAERYAHALGDHRAAMRDAFTRHGGVEVDTQGDAFLVAFADATAAVEAAGEAQRALRGGPIQVRMGIHTGRPLVTDEGYVGMAVHHGARVMSAGHGGQVLVSAATAALVEGFPLVHLGAHRLKDLSEPQPLYQLGEGDFPPLKTLHQTNLPIQHTALVGRERELAEARGLLADSRLVTLTGPGGTGKTKLALHVAANAVDGFSDGVWWVPLQAVRDPALVIPTIAQTLGAKERLAEHIGTKRLLLVLDNVEQLLAAAPELAGLLAATPNVSILATSREPLRIAGEREYPVEPLAEPDAVRLFREHAVVSEPVEAVAEICRRVDFLPLAVELAAARTRLLAPVELLARLERRLPLLTGGRRDAPERQRTLRATIEWSHELLSEEEQRLFARLAVFAGGFDLAAAEEVCGAELDELQSLIDKSLVRRWGSGRLGMLETIHELASERFAASPEHTRLRRRHAEHYAALAEAAERDYFGPAQPEALERLRAEAANIRAALAAGGEASVRIAAALPFFWFSQGQRREARRAYEAVAPHVGHAPPATKAKATGGRALFAAHEGDLLAAMALSDESLELARETGDDALVGQMLIIRQLVLFDDDAFEEAAGAAISLGRATGDTVVLGASLTNLADLALRRGRFEQALELLEEALVVVRQRGDPFNESGVLIGRASASLELGAVDAADADFRAALALARPLGASEQLLAAVEGLAAVAERRGERELGARLLGVAEALEAAHDLDASSRGFEACRRARVARAIESALGTARFAVARAEGARLAPEDALRL
jgi:predicted ATPase